MPFINDERPTGVSGAMRALLRHHAVEWGVAGIVVVTLVVTSSDLTAAPLAVLTRSFFEVLALVLGLLLANSLLRTLGVAQRFNEPAHHAGTILLGAFFSELLDWLIIRSGGDFAPAGWPTEAFEAVMYAAVFWGACLLIRALLSRASGERRRESLPQAGLLGMLPESLRRDIRWMKAEGNYVDVYGSNDHELVNYVFSRAVEEVGPLGLQVHRSYWVARDALVRVETEKGRVFAVVKGEQRIPVSRSYVREVKRAVES